MTILCETKQTMHKHIGAYRKCINACNVDVDTSNHYDDDDSIASMQFET